VSAPLLVTGATGFIGRETVRRLLAAGRDVIVLARDRDGTPAARRVATALEAAPGPRLQVVEGDLTAPACGLAPADLRRLRAGVETVIHCAGDTTFAPEALGPYRAGHVDGPRALLDALAGGRLARWAQLSTAFVCGRRGGLVREAESDVGQTFHNVYERVKLEAETVVRAAGRRRGVDVRVFRPSIVVGAAPPTAGGTPSSVFFGFIRLAAALARLTDGRPARVRIAGAPDARFNIVPVDYVAAALVALAEHPGAAGRTFHLVARDAPTQAELLSMLAARLGVSGLALVDARRGALDDPSPLERRIARRLQGYEPYLVQDVRFDDANVRALLDARLAPPPHLTRDVVDGLIDLALGAEAAPVGAGG
jgi:nucleoside-diphosphate-sugar epimerase